MVRPWLGGVGVLVAVLAWGWALAWSAGYQPAGIYDRLAIAADAVGLDGLAIAGHVQAAEEQRRQVRLLREAGASREELLATRSELANQLRAAYVIAERDGYRELALRYLQDAVKAAPERVDLQCLLLQARAQGGEDVDLKMSLLRLAWRHDAACAHWLLGEQFLREGRADTARSYLERAVTKSPDLGPAHLLLSQMAEQAGDRKTALEHAVLALQHARDLGERLAASERVTACGGGAPPRERIIAEHLLQMYGWGALSGLAVLLFLLHPAIIGALRGRRQRTAALTAA